MVASYNQHGIQLTYPENWQLVEEDMTEWPRQLTLQTPGGALLSLHVYPDLQDRQKLAEQAKETMAREYEVIDEQSLVDEVDGVSLVGYDQFFYFLDLLVSCRTRSFHLRGQTYVVMIQAEDREYEALREVFRAVLTALMRGVASPTD